METQAKFHLLQSIYTIFDGFLEEYDLACQKGCARCCTRNVTVTTLEGAAIMRHPQTPAQGEKWKDVIRQAAAAPRFKPGITINRLAVLCAGDEDIPEEAANLNTEACPFLKDDICTIYAMRPFGCRAMVSRTPCESRNEAAMPELVLTVNNVLMQYIEALDIHGLTGNLIDIVGWLTDSRQRETYLEQKPLSAPADLLANQPISVLMIPPEHRQRVGPVIEALVQAEKKSCQG